MHAEKYPLISSLSDPRFQQLKSLQSYKRRAATGLFLIEGVRHLARAHEEKAQIEQIFTEPSIFSNPFGQKLVRQLRKSGIAGIRLTPRLYQDLTLASEPQGVGAVIRQQWTDARELRVPHKSLWLAIEAVDQAGNLGTILRTAEAAGVSGVFLLGEGADPFDPVAVRASMGSLFSQRIIRTCARDLITWARDNRVSMVGSSPSGLLSYKHFQRCGPVILLIGSERNGLSPELLDAAHFTLRIPMHGRCDSVNAAIATGVLLFELAASRDG